MSFPLDALRAADARCLDAGEPFLDADEGPSAPPALGHLTWELTRARSLARSCDAATPFEALVVRHLEASWELLEQTVRYRAEWPAVPPYRLLDALAGPRALDRLEATLAALDHRDVSACLEAGPGSGPSGVAADALGARDSLERATAELARAFRGWLRAREGELPGSDAEIVLGGPESARTLYEPEHHRVVLSPAELVTIREGDGGFRIGLAIAARSLSRELAGRAVQTALSRDLPEFLRPDHRTRVRLAALPLAEGFAEHRASLSLPFLEAQRAELRLSERDLDRARELERLAIAEHALAACLGALAARARQEPSFDPVAHLSKRLGHSQLGERVLRAVPDTFRGLLRAASGHFGLDLARQTAAELADQGVEGADAVTRLGWGAWAVPCYREAVLGEDQEAG